MSRTESEMLTDWFKSQNKFRTWAEFAKYLGIDHRTISHYHMGRKLVMNPDHRALIYDATKIPAFVKEKPVETGPPNPFAKVRTIETREEKEGGLARVVRTKRGGNLPVVKADVNEEKRGDDIRRLLLRLLQELKGLESAPERVGRPASPTQPVSARGHAQKTLSLLHSLDRELSYFRDASKTEREVLRRIVHGQDVGYITSLLRALYDEDKFESWQLFATYRMRSGDSIEEG